MSAKAGTPFLSAEAGKHSHVLKLGRQSRLPSYMRPTPPNPPFTRGGKVGTANAERPAGGLGNPLAGRPRDLVVPS